MLELGRHPGTPKSVDATTKLSHPSALNGTTQSQGPERVKLLQGQTESQPGPTLSGSRYEGCLSLRRLLDADCPGLPLSHNFTINTATVTQAAVTL